MARRKWHVMLTANTVFYLLVMFYLPGLAQTPASAPAAPPGPGLCKDDASPGVIELRPDPANANKLALARKHFYLSPSPFNLAASVNLKTAPLLRSYYKGAGASEQLVDWLEDNHCETIYCREVTEAE